MSEHEHHILSNKASRNVLFFLMVFTLITVGVTFFDFGKLNFLIAMLIATAKAMAVMLYFMGLKYDNNENRAIFFGSFAFLSFFVFYTAVDLFNRDDSRWWKGEPVLMASQDAGGSAELFEQPWEPSEEIIAAGAEAYIANACQTCHGDEGYGDGPAGVALNARNFHDPEGWKNGREPTEVYRTLVNGLGSMPNYANLPPMTLWALTQYVLSFGPEAPEANEEELVALGLDPSKPFGGLDEQVGEQKQTIPVDFAIERYLEI